MVHETLPPEEIEFAYDTFVGRKDRAKVLRANALASSAAAAVQTTVPEASPVPSDFTLVSPDSRQLAPPVVSEPPAKILLSGEGRGPSRIVEPIRFEDDTEASLC